MILIWSMPASGGQWHKRRPKPMSHFALLTFHLFAAIMFVGTVFFEVLILEGIRKPVGREIMRTIELAIARRARRLMPFVMLVLYAAGFAMAWQYRSALSHPLASSFALLLWIKIGSRPAFWRISLLP